LMRLLLDMGTSIRTAEHFRALGHDAVHLREQHLQRMGDPDIMRKAVDERRVLVTFDLDFARLIALQRVAWPSVILLRLTQFTTDQVNLRLEDVVHRYATELESGAIVVLDDDRVRIRALPLW
jgi:predicted nuclease of predicted toxin-antitoxin system